jgi:hypothetical protein
MIGVTSRGDDSVYEGRLPPIVRGDDQRQVAEVKAGDFDDRLGIIDQIAII